MYIRIDVGVEKGPPANIHLFTLYQIDSKSCDVDVVKIVALTIKMYTILNSKLFSIIRSVTLHWSEI